MRARRLWRWLLSALLVVLSVVVIKALVVRPVEQDFGPAPNIPQFEPAEVAKRLAKVVQHPTVSLGRSGGDPNDFVALRQTLRSLYPRTFGALEAQIVAEHSLLLHWPGSDDTAAPILLAAHLDVVPVESSTRDAWEQPPFSGAIADGYVWGRGSIDDKLSTVAILEAIELSLVAGFRPKRTVWIAFGHDEEVGGQQGAVALAEELERRGVRLSFVLDEGGVIVSNMMSGLTTPFAVVGVAEKGYASLELVAHARGGHSSMPSTSTAVGRLAEAVARVQAEPMPSDLRNATEMMLDRITPHAPFGLRLALANRWLFEPLVLAIMRSQPQSAASVRTTTAPTMLRAGVADNILPKRASAVINFRILPGDTVEDVMAHVTEIVGPEIEVRCLDVCRDPTEVSSIEHPGFKAIERTIGHVFPGVAVAPYLVVGGTDARHYAHLADAVYRFLPITLEPSDTARMHGVNERLSVDNAGMAVRFYLTFLRNAAG